MLRTLTITMACPEFHEHVVIRVRYLGFARPGGGTVYLIDMADCELQARLHKVGTSCPLTCLRNIPAILENGPPPPAPKPSCYSDRFREN